MPVKFRPDITQLSLQSNHGERSPGNAMLLVVVTGQRLGDISEMKFRDVWDDHLHVIRQKTGTRPAIPLSYSVRHSISACGM